MKDNIFISQLFWGLGCRKNQSLIKSKETEFTSKKFSLLLRLLLVLLVIPVILLIMLFSLFIPQKQWQDFWEQFYDD